MIQDWKKEIAIAWKVRQALEDADIDHVWEYFLPRVAATEPQLRAAERQLGYPLDPGYRRFLQHANGWMAFDGTIDLFGTEEFMGNERMQNAINTLQWIEDPILQRAGVSREDLLPIAASMKDRDLFVIARPMAVKSGIVIWFAGGEVDRYPSFGECFLAMVDYNRLRLRRLQGEQKKGQGTEKGT